MKTLKLEHIAPYLPYGVKGFLHPQNHIVNLTGLFADKFGLHEVQINYEGLYALSRFKPILKPLSDLTKEIDHNGEKFVPIIELAKLVDNGHSQLNSKVHKSSNYITVLTDKCDDVENIRFRFIIEGFSCIERSGEPILFVTYDKIKSKLISWHFDIFGLIDKGIAIDINTLNK